MITIISFLIVIGICVISHEGGHFIAARFCNVLVHEFSFGMGPLIFSRKIGETQYSLRAFPVGGFVRLEGEDAAEDEEEQKDGEKPEDEKDDEIHDPERSLANKKPWERMLIIAAGALVNIALAWFITAIYLCGHGVYEFETARLGVIMDNSPALCAGIKTGDIVKSIDGITLKQWSDIRQNIQRADKEGDTFDIVVDRDGEELKFSIDVPVNKERGGRLLGVQPAMTKYSPGRALLSSFSYSWNASIDILRGLWLTITRKIKADVTGPVGIATMAGDAFRSGFWTFISFLGLINLNLGLLNLLPFPALDGGRLVFIAVELVTGRKMPQKYESLIHYAGLWVLLALVALVTSKDIYRLIH